MRTVGSAGRNAPVEDYLDVQATLMLRYSTATARVRSYCDALMYRQSGVGGGSLQVVGFYDDNFVTVETVWMISKRILSAVHFEGNLEVLPSGVGNAAYVDA